MDPKKAPVPVLRKIASGYARLAASLALWLGASLIAVAAASAIVWPLWALATNRRSAYNALFLIVAASCALALALGSLRRRLASGESPGRIALRALSFVGLVLAFGALALSGYLALVLFSRGLLAGAIPSLIAFIALAGYLFFGRKRGA